MSTAILVGLGVLVIGLAFWYRLQIRRALGIQHLIGTGHAFLVIGAIAGAMFDPIQSARLVADMTPLLALAAGWVGFASGMRFEADVLAPVPRRAFAMALAPALAAAALVGGASAAILWAADVPGNQILAVAGAMAAAAAGTGPTLAAILRNRRAGRVASARPVLRMIELSAGLDDAIVVLVALVAFALARPVADQVAAPAVLLLSLGGGLLLGMVTWLLLGGRAADSERLLLGLGILTFTAGYGAWLLLPPAAVTAIAAVVLTNIPGKRAELLLQAVRRVERPAVVLLMLIIGFVCVGPLHWVVFPLILAMTGLRLAAKHWTADLVAGPVPGAPGLSGRAGWGLGLLSQGNLGLVMVLSLLLVWGDPIARSALVAAAGASLINELIAPMFLVRALRTPGDTAPPAPPKERG
jgi:hypothetical protein